MKVRSHQGVLGLQSHWNPVSLKGRDGMPYTLPSQVMGLQYLLRNECGMVTKFLATNCLELSMESHEKAF